jgi:hypothetical protein
LKTLILPLIQIPLFVSFTYSIRNLAGAKFLWFDPPNEPEIGMDFEGILFLQNLSQSDPTLITPLLVASFHAINFEV